MSGDPLEESGQQLRQGAIQAFQMAHTTAALMRGRGGESRSWTEHEQRVRIADSKEGRSVIEHNVRVNAAIDEAIGKREVSKAKVDEIKGRISHNTAAHGLAEKESSARISRAETDLKRRNRLGRQEFRHKEALQGEQIRSLQNREARAAKLQELTVEDRQLQIRIRRRAAGLADTLSGESAVGDAETATAAFAAAKASEDLSEEHAQDAAAYERRFHEDTGLDYDEVIEPAVEDPGIVDPVAPTRLAVIDAEIIDAEVVDITETGEDAEVAEPEYPALPGTVSGLAQDLTVETHVTHEVGDPDDVVPDLDPAESVAEAVQTALAAGEDALVDAGLDAEPGLDELGPHDRGSEL